ncbi:MAG TPA: segregation/condensation protein A [Candidatus Paceibacterota bacterium]
MPISIKTPIYEGPLDLLLELIEKRKLLINDIALAMVTEEYLARVNSMESLPVGETAEFVALAATLLLIKSRSLLPLLTLTDEESEDIKELEYRLAVYQLVKNAAKELVGQLEEPMLYEGTAQEMSPAFIPDPSVTLSSLHGAAQALIAGFPQHLALPKVQVKTIMSIEEMIERLQERVTSALRLSFKEFAGVGKNKERGEIIISFLALLELVKQGIIKATQERDYGDITLESDSVSTPSYE